ncbi:hypothetical protein MnTg02_02114 [bacterium MnTg02]|nr:hypothetical protein MnTg02_02114 [bacterium MnTg02]
MASAEGQVHPISTYLWIWLLLFVFSFFSYLVDYFHLEGMLRWSLILLFMMVKAGFIVGIFMHMAWERLALIYAILLPPVFIMVFVALMTLEAENTLFSRITFFGPIGS